MGRAASRASILKQIEAQGVRAGRRALGKALSDRDRPAIDLADTTDFEIPGPAGPLKARLYQPNGAVRSQGLLLFFHGGGFTFCDTETHDALCRRLAHGSGAPIVSVDYRLTPEHAWPAQRDDAEAAVRWVAANRYALPCPVAPLILGGDSAGGYLALDLTRQLNAEQAGTIALTFLIYPLLQLDDAVWKTANAGLRTVGRVAVNLIRSRLVEAPPNLLEADPVGDPPCVLTYGGLADPVSPDCQAYEVALKAVGVPVHSARFKALPHGYANMTHLLPQARRAIDRTADLLRLALTQA